MIATRIVKILGLPSKAPFFDLCCGSGAVSLAAVDAGQDPASITMVDQSPWGTVWESFGKGTFDVDYLEDLIETMPKDPYEIPCFLRELAVQPAVDHVPEIFLLLQSAAFSGRQVSINNGRWKTPGLRSYWTPKPGSQCRSPVYPLKPQPSSMLERVRDIATKMLGVRGICADVRAVIGSIGSGTIYIDPPYSATTGYAYELPLSDVVLAAWISEAKPLSAISVRLSAGRAKGGHAGVRRRVPREEWLSFVSP